MVKMENLLIFGGKGGVGKSSISTATAVHLADQLQDQTVLLISFDIAHNLSDLFGKTIGNDVTQITKNLFETFNFAVADGKMTDLPSLPSATTKL